MLIKAISESDIRFRIKFSKQYDKKRNHKQKHGLKWLQKFDMVHLYNNIKVITKFQYDTLQI